MSAARKAVPWAVTVVALGAAGLLLFGKGRGVVHPDPRPDAEALAMTVLPASSFAGNPQAIQAYQMARAISQTLDGIYCHCHCKEEMGHRSLLTCFQSPHGSGCDVCMGEAQMAYQMQQQGKRLEDIRVAIDVAYGS